MPTLYTLPDCNRCQQARTLLAPGSYVEVTLKGDAECKMRQQLGRVIAPVLEREGNLYLLAQTASAFSWTRIR